MSLDRNERRLAALMAAAVALLVTLLLVVWVMAGETDKLRAEGAALRAENAELCSQLARDDRVFARLLGDWDRDKPLFIETVPVPEGRYGYPYDLKVYQ